ncbi:hypothetical protein E3T46_07820 [Cryobacterium sp. Hh11]|uniref:hypothetical protein n=1 Tax=Cryobacterium sp. Hh11 TaxID=2555868 RepID=UPI00106BDC03|nr:hypothetical protein [Cryobacterium sp. Hh11]TFD51987.1 hypothetical protein E3T46_07820 [Cryobacterium sp. Hh11]
MTAPIKREDIKAGDRVRMISEYTATTDHVAAVGTGTTYELIERAVVLPLWPGYYLDRQGDAWELATSGRWIFPADAKYDRREAEFAPFTRLRPEAEVAAEVLGDIKETYGENFLDNSNAAWNEVAEKWATK